MSWSSWLQSWFSEPEPENPNTLEEDNSENANIEEVNIENNVNVEEAESENSNIEVAESMTRTLQIANAAQTRFSLIRPNQVNPNVVVAGIRDNNLGQHGRNIIRICNPAENPNSLSNFHRIVIDPKGFSNKNNLHIPVRSSTVKAFGYAQQACEVIGETLFYASVILTGARLWSASKSEKGILPEAALVTTEYAGGYLGGTAGAQVGALAGSIFGPLGTVGGAVVGSFGGSYYTLQFVKSNESLIERATTSLTQQIF